MSNPEADELAQQLVTQATSEGRTVLVVGKGAHCTDLFDRIVAIDELPQRRSRSRRYIQYANGAEIHFRPATPDVARGFLSCDTLCILAPITEAARASAEPTLSNTDEPMILSTFAYAPEEED
ncbi:hypothetical protein PBI_WALRUS_81 [Gordonia phage Walrus]|uniref:Uncharacterized protein n=1 Tax=Gordonia phage Walrus TaxID=2517927 RepID=A0A481S2T6_9CAUD|nr:hypothetical protein KNU50_gp81 [Gordonia phage Walrus]QBG78471.1 hypothetical protein PBI_WALRUS_81 [Gordonia phage Walrus]